MQTKTRNKRINKKSESTTRIAKELSQLVERGSSPNEIYGVFNNPYPCDYYEDEDLNERSYTPEMSNEEREAMVQALLDGADELLRKYR